MNKREQDKVTIKLLDQKLSYPDNGAVCTYFEKPMDGELCAIVSLSKQSQKRPLIEVFGLLIHEAVHVWQAYVEGIKEIAPAKEQEAYAIQAISQELLSEYERRTQ